MIRWCQSGLQHPGHHSPGSTARRLSFSLASWWATLQAPMTHHDERLGQIRNLHQFWKLSKYWCSHSFVTTRFASPSDWTLGCWSSTTTIKYLHEKHHESTTYILKLVPSLWTCLAATDANVQPECSHYLWTQPHITLCLWENHEDANQQTYRWNMKEQSEYHTMLVQVIWQSQKFHLHLGALRIPLHGMYLRWSLCSTMQWGYLF